MQSCWEKFEWEKLDWFSCLLLHAAFLIIRVEMIDNTSDTVNCNRLYIFKRVFIWSSTTDRDHNKVLYNAWFINKTQEHFWKTTTNSDISAWRNGGHVNPDGHVASCAPWLALKQSHNWGVVPGSLKLRRRWIMIIFKIKMKKGLRFLMIEWYMIPLWILLMIAFHPDFYPFDGIFYLFSFLEWTRPQAFS